MLEISDHLPDYGTKTYDRYVVEAVRKARVQLIPEEIERRTKTEEQGSITGYWLPAIASRSRTDGIIDLTFLSRCRTARQITTMCKAHHGLVPRC